MTYRNTNIFFTAALLALFLAEGIQDIPGIAYAVLILLYLIIVSWGTLYISSQFFIPSKCAGDRNGQSIALTFDDGPVPESTQKILEILKAADAKATFFCIGKNVKENPEIVKQIDQDGHLLGNHTFNHGPLFDLQSPKKMMSEIRNTNTVIAEVTGRHPRFFRPPYGVLNPMLARAIKKLNLVTIGWSIRSFDTITKKKLDLFNKVTRNLKAGDVLLFHDRCPLTIEILPDLLAFIKNAGLKVESLDKVIGEKVYA